MKPGAPVEAPLPPVPRAEREWRLRDKGSASDLVESLSIEPLVARLLANREAAAPEMARLWLQGSLRDLPDPRAMHGMPEATERLLRALRDQELICIHGDYDVDGCTSVAILVQFLTGLGARVTWYAPHRHRDGYGVALHTVERLAGEGVKVLVTCDTGVSAHEAIALGNERGVDTIVCDHHTLPPELPAAHAIINPKLDGEDSPYAELAAVGVAFMLAVALRSELRSQGAFESRPEPDLRAFLDIVALGTVADLAPLRGINRLLVNTGLKVLAARRRPGLRALMEVAGIGADDPIEASHLGFRLGPRINAAGRLAEASRAVELLLSDEPKLAHDIASELDQYNRRRQETERRIVREALEQLAEDEQLAERRAVVLWSEAWHSGVVGIVASRIMHHLHKPALVIAVKDGVGTGSGRAIRGVDLFEVLKGQEHLLERFGGHRAAAGLTVRQDQLPALRAALAGPAFEEAEPELWKASLSVDAELDLSEVSWELYRAVTSLAPFGIGNPEPVFSAHGLTATGIRMLSKGGIRMDLQQGSSRRVKAVGFGLGVEAGALRGELEAVFCLQENRWRGNTTLELRLRGIRPVARQRQAP